MTCFSNRWKKAAALHLFLLFVVLAVPAAPAYCSTIVVKMATLAPEGSSWFKVLQDMGEEWKKASGGKVTLRIYPGGVAGDEDAMIRKMRIGQIQAAAISGMGLAYLDKSFFALHTPMMFESEEEFDYVRKQYSPVLEKKLADKGFIVLNWGDAGWIHFFTTSPVTTPDEAKKLKLFMSSAGGDPILLELYKEVGFRPVPLAINDLLPGLQTGMVNGFNSTPLVSLAFQWFGLAPNMIDLRWAFLSGATVIEKKAWEKIPADMREKLLEASRGYEDRLQTEVRRLNEEAIKVMVKNGLKIHKVSPEVKEQWRKMVEDVHPKVRGGVMPAEAFDAVKKFRDEFRARGGAGQGGPK